jgi:hypothetical protein
VLRTLWVKVDSSEHSLTHIFKENDTKNLGIRCGFNRTPGNRWPLRDLARSPERKHWITGGFSVSQKGMKPSPLTLHEKNQSYCRLAREPQSAFPLLSGEGLFQSVRATSCTS